MTHPNTTYPNTPLHIDIPVKLDEVKAVLSVADLSFVGDLPAPLLHLQLLTGDIADWGATSEVVVVFHTNAGHVTLNDAAYNADRNIETGNPCKDLVTTLMGRGVHVVGEGAASHDTRPLDAASDASRNGLNYQFVSNVKAAGPAPDPGPFTRTTDDQPSRGSSPSTGSLLRL